MDQLPQPPKSSNRLLWVILIGIVVFGITDAVVVSRLFFKNKQPESPIVSQTSENILERVTNALQTVVKPSEKPLWSAVFVKDGKVWQQKGPNANPEIIKDNSGKEIVYDVTTDNGLALSASGQYILWQNRKDNTTVLFDRETRQRSLTPFSQKLRSFVLSGTKDQAALLAEAEDTVYILDIPTKNFILSFSADGAQPLSFSPDNTTLLLRQIRQDPPSSVFYAVSLDTRDRKEVYTSASVLSTPFPEWLPDTSGLVVYEGNKLVFLPLSTELERKDLVTGYDFIQSYSPITPEFNQLIAVIKNRLNSLILLNVRTGEVTPVLDLPDIASLQQTPLMGVLTPSTFWVTTYATPAIVIQQGASISASTPPVKKDKAFTVWSIDTNSKTKTVLLSDVQRFAFQKN